MVDFIGESIKNEVDTAIRRMVNAEHFRAGSIISMPVTYPSGTAVAIEVTVQGGRCFISDRGGGFYEAEMFGASRYFRNEAERIAKEVGIRFDGREMFVAEVPKESLAGGITVVANASASAVRFAARRQAERADVDARDELYVRLSSLYVSKDIIKDAEVVGSSNHKWRISVMVSDSARKAFFEPVSNHYISVVGASAKFHDFANIEHPPARVAVVKSPEDLGDFYGVISSAATEIISMTASDRSFLSVLEAA